MNKKQLLCFFMVILVLGIFSTSCGHNDPELTPSEKEKQEISESLITAGGLDFSDILAGEMSVGMWYMLPDSTFVYYAVSDLQNGTDSKDWTIDSLYGTWNAFADMENPWGGAEEKISGFHVKFDLEDGVDYIRPEVDYYIVSSEDGVPITISEGAVEYAIMSMNDSEAAQARTRAFECVATRAWYDFISDAWDSVTDAFDDVANWFANFVGADQSSYNLDEEQSKSYSEFANKTVLPEMRNGASTNYSEWMGEIYKDKEVVTRICDMNIPGTHDTFTYYFTGNKAADATIGQYARTQSRDIRGQWDAGVRFFDLRLRSVNVAALDITQFSNPQWWYDLILNNGENSNILGIFHGIFFCGITAERGIQEIVNLLKEHPTETAIVHCTFEGDADADDYRLARELFDKFSDYVVKNPAPGTTLWDCAGKMLLLQGWDRNNSYPKLRIGPFIGTGNDEYNDHGYIQFWDYADKYVQNPQARLLYQNRFQSPTTKLCTTFWNEKREVMTACFNDARDSKGALDEVWSVNQASAYVGGISIHMSYSKNANTMNPWTLMYVYQHKRDKMGIIQMDFAGANEEFDDYCTNGGELPKVIVESNRWQ